MTPDTPPTADVFLSARTKFDLLLAGLLAPGARAETHDAIEARIDSAGREGIGQNSEAPGERRRLTGEVRPE